MKSRSLINSCISILVAVALLAALWLLQFRLQTLAARHAGNFISEQIETRLGSAARLVSFDEISPGFLNRLQIRNLRIAILDGLSVEIPHLVIRYDLRQLLSGNYTAAIHLLVAESPLVTVDTNLIQAALSDLRAGNFKLQSLTELFTDHTHPLRVDVRNARVRVLREEILDLRVRVRRATVQLLGGRLSYSLDGRVEADFEERVPELRSMAAVFKGQGELYFPEFYTAFNMEVIGTTNIAKLKYGRVLGSVNTKHLVLQLVPQNRLEKLDFTIDFASLRLELASSFNQYRPDTMFELQPAYDIFKPWLASVYSGSALAKVEIRKGTIDRSSFRFDVQLASRLPLDFPGGRARLDTSFYGSLDQLTFRQARLWNSLYDLSYRGVVKPATLGAEGSASVMAQADFGPLLSSEMEIYAAAGTVFAYAEELTVLSGTMTAATASLLWEGDDLFFMFDANLPQTGQDQAGVAVLEDAPISFGRDSLPSVTAYSNQTRPSVSLEGSLQLGAAPYLSARLYANEFSPLPFIAAVSETINPVALKVLNRIKISSDLNIFSNLKAVSYSANNAVIALEGYNSVYAILSLRGSDEMLDVTSINASLGSYVIRGTAGAGFRPGERLSLQADIAINDIPYALSASIMDGSLFVSGDYGLFVRVQTFDDLISASFRADNLPVEVAGMVFGLSADLQARYESLEDWSVRLQEIMIEAPSLAGREQLTLQFQGMVDTSGVRLPQLSLSSSLPLLNGGLQLDWKLQTGFVANALAELATADGEAYVLNAAYDQGEVKADLQVTRGLVSRLFPAIDGELTTSIALSGSLNRPRLSADFDYVPKRGSGSVDLSASGQLSYADAGLNLQNGRFAYSYFEGSQITASIDILEAAADYSLIAAALLPGSNGIPSVGGKLSGSAYLHGATDRPKPGETDSIIEILRYVLARSYSKLNMAGLANGFQIKQQGMADWPYFIDIDPDGLIASAGVDGVAQLELWRNGTVQAILKPELPVSTRVDGTIRDGSLDLNLKDILVRMPFLFDFLDIPLISVPSGVARGALSISGPLSDPDIDGSLDFSDFYLGLDRFLADTIGPITSPLYITGKNAEISQTDLRCGDGLLRTRMAFTLDSWIPDDIVINVKTNDPSLVHARTTLLGMQVDVQASTELLITIIQGRAAISGSIYGASGDVIITLDTLAVGTQGAVDFDIGGLADIRTDLRFNFGRSMRIYFPDKLWPILSGQSDPASNLRVYYDSLSQDMNIQGNILLRGGNVFYIKRNFYLKNASVRFNENQDSFNPVLTLEAETRSSFEGNPVVINLRALNTPLRSLNFTLDATPSLSDLEIAQLLGQDLIASTDSRSFDIGRALIENTDIIPQLNLVSVFEQNIQNFFGFDLFYLRSQLLQRWLYDLSRLGPADSSQSMTQYLDNTAIIAGKYLADNLFLQGSMLLQERQLEQQADLQLNLELSLEWQTPHFLINWSFRPEHPERLFISDQAISLFWRIPLK